MRSTEPSVNSRPRDGRNGREGDDEDRLIKKCMMLVIEKMAKKIIDDSIHDLDDYNDNDFSRYLCSSC